MFTNSRQAAVRKHGIQLATGDYIIHCDSDDWVDVDYYEKMYSEAVKSNADVVFAPIMDEYVDSSVLRQTPPLPNTGKELVSNWYKTNIGMFTWNKLVKRTIYTEYGVLPFEGVNMWEDNGLMLRALYYARKVSFITGPAYHYNHTNMGAMTVGYGRSAVDQMLKCADLLDKFFSEKNDAQRYIKTVNAVKYLAKLNLITTKYTGIREFKQIYPECDEAVHYISLKAFSTKGKIRFLFVKYHLSWLFVTLFKCKNLFTKK
jgi:glycosyltransferase involved in cell wall biosynthesis